MSKYTPEQLKALEALESAKKQIYSDAMGRELTPKEKEALKRLEDMVKSYS